MMNLPAFFDGDCETVEARIENKEYCQDDIIHLFRRAILFQIEIETLKSQIINLENDKEQLNEDVNKFQEMAIDLNNRLLPEGIIL